MEEKRPKLPHSLIIEDRRNLSVSGVTEVDNFNDEEITLYTCWGQLCIKGENLQLSVLNTDSGDVSASGKINSVVYSERLEKHPGFFSRVFK